MSTKTKERVATETAPAVQRRHAEDQCAAELTALAEVDDKPRPPSWKLSRTSRASTMLAACVLPVSAQTIHTDSDGLEAGGRRAGR